MEAVLNRKLYYLSLPETLKQFFLRGRHNLVVTGTHGKTTTSSLLAWILVSAGLDPAFMIGGIARNLDGSCVILGCFRRVTGCLGRARRAERTAETPGFLRHRSLECRERLRGHGAGPQRRARHGGAHQRRGSGHALTSDMPCCPSGCERTRLPVAAKIALHTAGDTGALAGSPTPPQKPPVGASTTSTFGISASRISR